MIVEKVYTFKEAVLPLPSQIGFIDGNNRKRWMLSYHHISHHNHNSLSQNLVSTAALSIFFIVMLALTGFVCTHKIQAEEECLSSNVLCYECDSRSDPNCADPFDFSSIAYLPSEPIINRQQSTSNLTTSGSLAGDNLNRNESNPELVTTNTVVRVDSAPIEHIQRRKKLPAVAVCHGCCVKITSKTPEGAIYVKRTCTTNLQINYFMVGLVCMKESGDRGKMCFCETDYCNGQPSNHLPKSKYLLLPIILITYFILKRFICLV